MINVVIFLQLSIIRENGKVAFVQSKQAFDCEEGAKGVSGDCRVIYRVREKLASRGSFYGQKGMSEHGSRAVYVRCRKDQ